MRNSEILHSSSTTGATLVEYALLVAFLGVVFASTFALFTPMATSFHDTSADGLFMPYPQNYLNPTPTATATPAPTP